MIDAASFDVRFGSLAGGLEREELEALVGRLRVLEVSAGETLITEGMHTSGLHLVWDGTLDVSVGGADRHVATVARGGCVGEVSLLDPGPASATVRSEEGATVAILEHSELGSFEREHPQGAVALLHELALVLAHRVRVSARELADAGFSEPLTVGAADPEAVSALTAQSQPVHFEAGATLGSAGRRAEHAFLIRSGSVIRRVPRTDGPPLRLELPGGSIAGGEVLLPAVLATDLTVERDVEALVLTADGLMRQAPDDSAAALTLTHAVAGQLARELRALTTAQRRLALTDAPTVSTDVAVIGGGVIGLAYAWFVKEARRQTAVTVLERRPVPGYKIGESTLGTTTRCMLRMGLNLPVLRRLFGIKAGIRFWWTSPGDTELRRHVDAGDVDETFQVERRVLETALMESARRRGIDIRTGTKVQTAAAAIGADGARLPCESRDGDYELQARVVCDASGPASVLPRRFGLYRRQPERFGSFNTNSYYAYFRQKEDVGVPFWEAPATRHICFEQGWCWFITVTSWEGTPQENLEAMIRFLLDHPDGPDVSYPTRRELEERFGCRSEPILSVGFTVRDDHDSAAGLSLEDRFHHYLDRYPVIARILEHYELIDAPYGKRPYSAFLNLAHDSAAVAGDGWCAVGDASGFTNPLFSPGMNFGTGTAYEAAQDTARALAGGDLSRRAFGAYVHYAERTYGVLMAFNDMLYRSFRHEETFERALALFFFHSATDVLQRHEYSETDPYVWDLLNPEFTRRVDAVRQVLRSAEERDADPEDVVREVRALTDPYIRRILARPEVQQMNLRAALREFDESGQRSQERYSGPGAFTAAHCGTCRLFYDAVLDRCPVCGTAQRP